MSDLPAIAFLRAAVAAMRGANDPEVIAGREAVATWLDSDRDALTFEEATGLKPSPGERSWRRQEAAARRDDLIRQLATTYFQHIGARDRASAIALYLADYAARHWWREREAPTDPHAPATANSFCWRIFVVQTEMFPGRPASAPSSRTVRKVLVAE